MMTRRSSALSESPAARVKRASPVGGGSGSASGSEPSEPLQWLSQMLPAEVTKEARQRLKKILKLRILKPMRGR